MPIKIYVGVGAGPRSPKTNTMGMSLIKIHFSEKTAKGKFNILHYLMILVGTMNEPGSVYKPVNILNTD